MSDPGSGLNSVLTKYVFGSFANPCALPPSEKSPLSSLLGRSALAALIYPSDKQQPESLQSFKRDLINRGPPTQDAAPGRICMQINAHLCAAGPKRIPAPDADKGGGVMKANMRVGGFSLWRCHTLSEEISPDVRRYRTATSSRAAAPLLLAALASETSPPQLLLAPSTVPGRTRRK